MLQLSWLYFGVGKASILQFAVGEGGLCSHGEPTLVSEVLQIQDWSLAFPSYASITAGCRGAKQAQRDAKEAHVRPIFKSYRNEARTELPDVLL